MRRITIFLISLLTTVMVTSTFAAAHQGEPHMPPHHDSPMMGPGGFSGGVGEMDISGNVSVDDAITIELTVSPSEEMRTQMADHHRNVMPENFSNTITVKVDQLVEFVDLDSNGYSSNDTILSTYALNGSNLNAPVYAETDNGSMYTITSVDNAFTMYLYLNEVDGVPHSWKWSVDINYAFTDISSSLAILQSIVSNGGHPMMEHRMMEQHGPFPPEGMINQTRMQDEHANVPMFFKWDETAIVDDVITPVTASHVDGKIAISFPQGSSIFYDPEVGVDLNVLDASNSFLTNLFQSFAETVNSPSVIGITVASVMVAAVVVLTKVRK